MTGADAELKSSKGKQLFAMKYDQHLSCYDMRIYNNVQGEDPPTGSQNQR
ncbi:hypothetical protein M404DRAFT_31359 [Pisolithus tinctorius Marx 270]|uniref:Uncharacterized protein n=1 Tax=Pisolithus tinctorius Marx 270 TaxID=870435 RepID=A0A0C3NS95_PISTI|nr:hypothetical protein M404DRAFT_31359 [Pisolithus tinctorius Marx 270]